MARPRLRRPVPLVVFSNRNGATPDASQSHGAAQDRAAEDGAARGSTANASTEEYGSTQDDGSAAYDSSAAYGSTSAYGSTAEYGGALYDGSAAYGGSTGYGGSAHDDGGTAAYGSTGEDGSSADPGAAAAGAAADAATTPMAPVVWPAASGAAAPSPAETPEAAETAASPADVPFWDWAPSEESIEPADPGREAATSADREPRPSWGEPVVRPVEDASDETRREGIGQHLGNLAHLSANPRMRAWQRRAIIAIVVGVVFTIVVSWRLGLTFAVLAAIADTIYRSRTAYSGQGEARLTSAQRHTRRQLGKLARAGYRAVHCVPIPDSEERIDHLVVGPAGVYAIDSEAWNKRLPVRTKSGRQLWHGPHSMKDRLEHARWESERAAELLSGAHGSRVTVRPAMAVYGPKIPWDVATIREVDVFSGPRLRKYLRRRLRQSGERPLNANEIESIDKAAHAAFPHGAAT